MFPKFSNFMFRFSFRKEYISLLVAVMFYKVASNTEFVNTEPLLLGEMQGCLGSCEPLTTHFNISIHDLVLGMFLFKGPCLIHIVDSLILNSSPTKLTHD